MRPSKIVKRQMSLFAHGQAHLTTDHFFSPAHLNSLLFTIYYELKKKKNKNKNKKSKARRFEYVRAFKN